MNLTEPAETINYLQRNFARKRQGTGRNHHASWERPSVLRESLGQLDARTYRIENVSNLQSV